MKELKTFRSVRIGFAALCFVVGCVFAYCARLLISCGSLLSLPFDACSVAMFACMGYWLGLTRGWLDNGRTDE